MKEGHLFVNQFCFNTSGENLSCHTLLSARGWMTLLQVSETVDSENKNFALSKVDSPNPFIW